MKAPDDVVFLSDCDNKLLDNDRVVVDLRTHLESECGPRNPGSELGSRRRFAHGTGHADYLNALQRYRLDAMNDPRFLQMSFFSRGLSGC
jgi:hypothetical protein